MAIDNVFRLHSAPKQREDTPPNIWFRVLSAVQRQCARAWCGMHGHLILLHFQPNKLSLQCGLCGYESEGWDVGRPLVARRHADNRAHARYNVRTERRGTLRAVPPNARMAS